jgi:hypothetical protein
MLRLFETGHREEARLIAELRAAGHRVDDRDPTSRRQWAVSAYGGHFRGHLDGRIWLEGEWCVLETKTANTKSWRAIHKHGVAKEKPVHYAQMQFYMGLTEMRRALYLCVCKENDDIHEELVDFDEPRFRELMDGARSTIEAIEPPERFRDDPAYYLCLWCPHHGLCHDTAAPRIDCRTCLHSSPDTDCGGWRCELAVDPIPDAVLQRGCPRHLFLPVLLERRLGGVVGYDDAPSTPCSWVEYQHGTRAGDGGLSSAQIVEMPCVSLREGGY